MGAWKTHGDLHKSSLLHLDVRNLLAEVRKRFSAVSVPDNHSRNTVLWVLGSM